MKPMPKEFETMRMTSGGLTVAEFIRSRPQESAPYLISAVQECISKKRRVNQAELQIAARAIRYQI